MRSRSRGVVVWAGIVFALVSASESPGQNPTGTLTGAVVDIEGSALPGALVVATSPRLQGSRRTRAGSNGSYKLAFLPPGVYQLSVELEGFSTSRFELKINAAQTSVVDVEMDLARILEEVVVTSDLATISQTRMAATTFDHEEVEQLAVSRDILSSVELTPGAHATAPASGGAISISGAMSFENLWLINGVVINENVRGGNLPLYIEDAVQEITTSVAGISAEYGRFSGGVINVLTKSGGNRLSGSLRDNVSNEDWRSRNAGELSGDRIDHTNQELEATLGGPFWRDHLWFFFAGREREEKGSGQTAVTHKTYPTRDAEERSEVKLTFGFALGPTSHALIGSYLEIDRRIDGDVFGQILDLRSVPRDTRNPQELVSGNYTGILSPSFFVEAQVSQREFTLGVGYGGPAPATVGSGSLIGDLIPGTVVRDRPTGRTHWAHYFCGTCEPEVRNNEDRLIRASAFLQTERLGAHDLSFGADVFSDIRYAINHQSGSDFQVWADRTVFGSQGEIFPVFSGPATWLVWWPPLNLDVAVPTDFETTSFYLADEWALDENWSFDLGVRVDTTDGHDSGGARPVDDTKVSPRLGLTWDAHGSGELVVHAGYGRYVAAIANTIADSTSIGGNLGGYFMMYGLDEAGRFVGPTVNTACQPDGTDCVGTEDALQTLYEWYFGHGGTVDVSDPLALFSRLPGLFYSSIPGVTAVVPDSLRAPEAEELTVGVSRRLGTRGLVRADVVHREWKDFYSNRTTASIQTLPDGTDVCAGCDLTHIGNFGDALLEREYLGFNVQARFRPTRRLALAGNYTWSRLEGNIDGESPSTGPQGTNPFAYPEYKLPEWNVPVGRLAADQEHKLQLWMVVDLLERKAHTLNVSVLHSLLSGQPYGAVGGVDARSYVANPGYQQPPLATTYYFTARDAFETEDVTRTDLALNYAFRWTGFGHSMEIFVQPEVVNLFDEDAVLFPRAPVLDATTGGCSMPGGCRRFDPFTETPVEGVHWERGPGFGEPDGENDFQAPREFRFSVGVRF